MMKLLKFRVTNFRSVADSGWIETNDVTALIGTNEAGKTNLLIPLWKLKPAKGGAINAISDYPRKRYNEIRAMEAKPVFIQAYFELDNALVEQIVSLTGAAADDVRVAEVSRIFSGGYMIAFPNEKAITSINQADAVTPLTEAYENIIKLEDEAEEEGMRDSLLAALRMAQTIAQSASGRVELSLLNQTKAALVAARSEGESDKSVLMSRYVKVINAIADLEARANGSRPSGNQIAQNLVEEAVPSFVYYSNYGNLDSEIYLPHVIENMERTNLGNREQAKARTLKVLFEFVKLQPKEILELGHGSPIVVTKTVTNTVNQFNNQINTSIVEDRTPEPTDAEIKQFAEETKEREILLTSASTDLTGKYRDWWRQGTYRFRFQADGDHFRIWVSDDKRPEEIELEGRSTGLQWFLSFYLTFLVESADDHKDAILLLDEPGQSLHPLAQQDLSKFFDKLAQTNQIIYTAHSPFLVDADHLDRVKAVYVDETGATAVSADLRASQKNTAQAHSVYPVNAALGLSVSDTMLEGCQPVIVEGPSDQIYLSAIKIYLIRKGQFAPSRETIFVPSGGVKGVQAVMPVLAAKTEALPYVILDSDGPGKGMADSLKGNVYKGQEERIIQAGDVCGMEGAEIEDLFPTALFSIVIDKYLRGQQDEDFSEAVEGGKPIVSQVEAYAKKHELVLARGWKVEVARLLKARLLSDKNPIQDDEAIERWKDLFGRLQM